MKTNTFKVGAALVAGLVFSSASAQLGINNWSLTGNNITAAQFIGTTNAQPFRIFTGGNAAANERLRILNTNGNVGIGTTTPLYKLHVNNSLQSITGYFASTAPNAECALKAEYTGVADAPAIIGINNSSAGDNPGGIFNGNLHGIVSKAASGDGIGSYGSSWIGLYGSSSLTNESQTFYGVIGEARIGGPGTQNTGVEGFADGFGVNYGIVGISMNGSTNYSGYFSAPYNTSGTNNYAGFFAGDVTVSGVFSNPSDLKLKENIQPMSNSLVLINKLQPKNYNYKGEEASRLNLPQGKQFGLIAQELEEVFPEMVTKNIAPPQYDKDHKTKIAEAYEFKGINYIGLIPVLIQGIKEQQAQIEKQEARIDELEAKLNKLLEQNSAALSTPKPSTLNAWLKQNAPNPFGQSTLINYSVPTSAKTATLKVYGIADGREFLSQPINERGEGSINVSGNLLSAGTYAYDLIIDGQVIDHKTMIIVK